MIPVVRYVVRYGERAAVPHRMAQEAPRSHPGARARRVPVTFDRRRQELLMQIRDDGRGCDACGQPGRAGVGVNRGERVRVLGGRLDGRTAPGGGACLAVSIPIGASHAA